MGSLHVPGYRAPWYRKADWYRRSGIGLIETGGGARGTLATTRDDAIGGKRLSGGRRDTAYAFEPDPRGVTHSDRTRSRGQVPRTPDHRLPGFLRGRVLRAGCAR